MSPLVYVTILMAAIILYLLYLLYQRHLRDHHIVLERLLQRFENTLIDYGTVPRYEFNHPLVRWDTIGNIIHRMRSSHDEVLTLKLTDNTILKELGVAEIIGNDVETLRIQSPHYHEGLHYDCYDQVVTQILGRKKWILFDLTFDTVEEELEFVDMFWKSTGGIHSLSLELDRRGVSYDIVTLSPGHTLSIPMNRWHQTEGFDTHGGICIMTNTANTKAHSPTYEEARSICVHRFDRLFPAQQKACRENGCRY